MAHTRSTPLASVVSRGGAFLAWFGESLIHALGNPGEERRFQPPLVGVQPYCDRPWRPAR